MKISRSLIFGCPLVAMTLSISVARAAGPPIDVRALEKSGRAHRYEATFGESSLPGGGAAIVVHANIATVRAIVSDFGSYERFMNFRRSRVIRRDPKGTDVYLQVPILHGAAKLWAVVRFSPVQKAQNGELIVGRKLDQGNVKEFQAEWRLRPIDESKTLLQLELLLVPTFPVPTTLLVRNLMESAEDGVKASRVRAEAARGQ